MPGVTARGFESFTLLSTTQQCVLVDRDDQNSDVADLKRGRFREFEAVPLRGSMVTRFHACARCEGNDGYFFWGNYAVTAILISGT